VLYNGADYMQGVRRADHVSRTMIGVQIAWSMWFRTTMCRFCRL
jgi:hypothetical protein